MHRGACTCRFSVALCALRVAKACWQRLPLLWSLSRALSPLCKEEEGNVEGWRDALKVTSDKQNWEDSFWLLSLLLFNRYTVLSSGRQAQCFLIHWSEQLSSALPAKGRRQLHGCPGGKLSAARDFSLFLWLMAQCLLMEVMLFLHSSYVLSLWPEPIKSRLGINLQTQGPNSVSHLNGCKLWNA